MTKLLKTARAALPLACALATWAAAPAHAQGGLKAPPRPALWAAADTNSARAYYTHGLSRLETRPDEAAAAFYWAARIEPGWAEPLYARRVALLLADPNRLMGYMERDRRVLRRPEVMALDSLQLRALALNPFLHLSLERLLLRNYLRTVFYEATRSSEIGNYDVVDALMSGRNPGFRASLAAAEGRFPEAIREYEKQLPNVREKQRPRMRAELGRLHFLSGSLDQATAHLAAAIEGMRREEDREVVYVYESKAVLELTLAAIHAQRGDTTAAREAYGRALQEDLALGAAHARLSALSLAEGDTAAALASMALAVELAPTDAAQRHAGAMLMLLSGRGADAAAELEKAAELEPYFAAPRFWLAALHDRAGERGAALRHYRAFLERASRDDPLRPRAEARLPALEAAERAEPKESPR